MEKFESAFKMPFHLDRYGETYVWDNNKNQMVLMFSDEVVDSDLKKAVVECINTGEFYEALKGKEFTNPNNDDEIFMNGEYFMCVRGWGYLTSRNCMNLSTRDAAEIQDNLVEFIIKRLNP